VLRARDRGAGATDDEAVLVTSNAARSDRMGPSC
jgi:hypothetical protein